MMTEPKDICERLSATGLNTPGTAERDVAKLRNSPFTLSSSRVFYTLMLAPSSGVMWYDIKNK